MTCSRLREWVKIAQPNARIQYGEGTLLQSACTSDVRELVMALYNKGMLTPFYIKARDGKPAQYIVQRSARPYLRGMEL